MVLMVECGVCVLCALRKEEMRDQIDDVMQTTGNIVAESENESRLKRDWKVSFYTNCRYMIHI
jgi:hypothetical protein